MLAPPKWVIILMAIATVVILWGLSMQKAALYTATVIFLVVSLAHLLRYVAETEIVVGGVVVPVSLSLVIGLVFMGLALWQFVAGRRS
jgi:hypothetical protein